MKRGSVWRRWDLHIHTPQSALANLYGDWDSYLTALEEKGADVSVVGITDYCSIEGYKRVVEARRAGRLDRFDLIVPNIEFRTHPETKDGKGINLHILVDPSLPDHVESIERCLGLLTFRYDGVDYPCTTTQLTALGRAVDPAQTDDRGAFKAGVNAFKPSFEALRDWLDGKGRWLAANGLVVVANSKDGPSGLSSDAGFAAARSEIYRQAQMIFSANPKDRLYFLGQGTDDPETVRRKNGSLKPCIHGSDAHSEGKLFQPDEDRYCWIKAEPTFEGLRQLLHEPEDRVAIGPTPPEPVDASKVIARVTLSGADAWFPDGTVELNAGLVTIIGEKGSGKTALAELIAFGTFACSGDRMPASFISKAEPLIRDLAVKVEWLNGAVSERRIADGRSDELPRIRYLSQDFVEELCSTDSSGRRLISEIEQVVFGHIAESDRLGASDFSELRRLRTDRINERKREVNASIARLNREVLAIEARIAGRPEKERLLARARADIESIDAQLPALQATVDRAVADEIERLGVIRTRRGAEMADANRRYAKIGNLRAKMLDFVDEVAARFEEMRPDLLQVGLTEDDIRRVRPVLPENPAQAFDRLLEVAREQVSALAGDPAAPQPFGETLADLDTRVRDLEGRLATDERQRERLVELQQGRKRLEGDASRLEAEVASLRQDIAQSLEAKKDERVAAYLAHFDLLAEERAALVELYAPLQKVIAEGDAGAEQGFELDVRLSAAPEEWLNAGQDLFDKRRNLHLTTPSAISELRHTLFLGWASSDRDVIRTAMTRLCDSLGTPTAISEQLLAHASVERVHDWLFSTDHIRIDYSLRYRGTDLERLSPGTRGIVLLVLYLSMDRQDRRPLVIDQPEGNLDNSSIYAALVPFLRRAKRHRQVILVTHNPNLVVTTDAEQIIVARAERPEDAPHPRIIYASGALEETGTEEAVRSQTVKLLEGGADPFRARESRYALR